MADSSAVFNIALEKEREKEKESYNNTANFYFVTHPSTNPIE